MKNFLFLILLSLLVNIITVNVDGRSIPENSFNSKDKNDFMNMKHINPRSNYHSNNPWDHTPYHPSNNPWDRKPYYPSYNPWDRKPYHPSYNPWDRKPYHPSNNHWYNKPNYNRKKPQEENPKQNPEQAATSSKIQSYAQSKSWWEELWDTFADAMENIGKLSNDARWS